MARLNRCLHCDELIFKAAGDFDGTRWLHVQRVPEGEDHDATPRIRTVVPPTK